MNAVRLAIILTAILAPATPATDYFPLNPGNQWSYTMSNGLQMTVAITGFAPVGGIRCAIVETSTGWQKSREYMAADADGLKTYKTEAQGQELVYDPPVIRIKMPPAQGQTWTSTVNQSGMTITTTNQTEGTERVQTPVGAFECLKVRSTASVPGQPPMVSQSYYAAGLGLVHQIVQAGGQQMTASLVSTNVKPTQTPATPAGPTRTTQDQPALDQYQSPDGTVRLYKPRDWSVQRETPGPGVTAVSVIEPQENAAVIFMTFPVDQEINDSVKLMARCVTALREEYPDIKATRVNSSPERQRTIAEVALTVEGKKAVGHGYFFHTQRMGTVYVLLAREDMWDTLRPTLTTVAANLAYAPEGIAQVVAEGQALADQGPAAEGATASPAAMIQRASRRPGKQLPLRQAALSDQSMTLQIPQGWSLQGQKLQFTTFADPQTKLYGVGSGSHTIIPTQMPVPGTINAPYQPPAQALRLILEFGQIGTDIQVLGECPTEEAVPEAAQAIQSLRAQGFQVDARLLHVRFRGLATGATLRGMFAMQCNMMPMSPVWQILADGNWAPDSEYDEWLPLYLRIGKSTQANQQWFAGEMQDRQIRQQQLNRNLQNSIAESNRAFDDYMGSLRDADRSRDYVSHMWSQTTLGQGTWVAEHEGAKVYQTDSWGIEGPEGRIDRRAYNTTNFTGENPWGAGQLEMVDTRAEYERYIANR